MAPMCKPLKQDDIFFKFFKGSKKAYIVEPSNCMLPGNAPTEIDKIMSFQAREDDIYVVTFVKAGTALIQEMVYVLVNDINLEKANNSNRAEDFPYFEGRVWEGAEGIPDGFKLLNDAPSPRLIKTHLPYTLMPPSAFEKKSKMIYVARNMKDVMVSYYHFSQTLTPMDFQGEFSDFVELFLEDKVPYCPFIQHVEEFWERRHEPNILFLTYEDMRKDLAAEVQKVADFLGKKISKDDMIKILDHCSFESMKVNPAVNKTHYASASMTIKNFQYLRKGIVGDWKNHFSPELRERFKAWLDKNVKSEEMKKLTECDI